MNYIKENTINNLKKYMKMNIIKNVKNVLVKHLEIRYLEHIS